MKIWPGLVAGIVLILSGCADPDMADVPTEPAKKEVKIEVPDSHQRGAFLLPVHNGTIRVGDTESEVRLLQPTPSTEVTESSPIKGGNYRVIGWNAGQETFAAIMLENRLVLGLITIKKVNKELYAEHYQNFRGKYEDPGPPDNSEIVYHFWEKDGQRLMQVYSPDSKNDKTLTMAVGVTPVMDALGMSKVASQGDIKHAMEILGGNLSTIK